MQFVVRSIPGQQRALACCRSHSTGAGKIYELRTYAVKPSKMKEYMKVEEDVLPKRMEASKMNGSWYTELGGLNEAMYLWEFDSFSHRTAVRRKLAADEEWRDVCLPKVLPLLSSQTNMLLKPFSWYKPVLDPVKGYGMYELVIHHLKPGMVSQFEHVLQQGLHRRLQYDYPKPLGIWSIEFGHANRVLSIFPHVDFEERENHRREIMNDNEWKETWRDTMKFMNDVTVKALVPANLSPLQ